MLNKLQHATPVSATDTHATSAVATISGIPAATMYVTDISGSSDKAGSILTVKQGSTTIWEVQLASTVAGINAFSHTFASPLVSALGASISVTVDGTAVCKSNIAGFYL